ncbi:MAG: malto-oligosyltrehalose synthase, partial [Phycisphaerae bacterium]|nr:malto-oligosyltrehalose synthase [Phycisphaerae bacterium]
MPSEPSIDSLLRRAIERATAVAHRPNSTYRLQLHKEFNFRDAAAIVPYLASLGVTHIYSSPILKAQPGSTHGYDVIDHCSLNPELGTREDFNHLCEVLKQHDMSQIVDIVPNHAGVATNENNWWNDALKNGPDAKFGGAFDISWTGSPRTDLHNRVLLPTLGKPYDEALTSGEIKLKRDSDGAFVYYFDRRFPIRDGNDIGDIDAINASPDALDELLTKQFYRLAYWRVAPDEINYRRFFNISDLAALAMEKEWVFTETHALTLRLIAQGKISGLRIDHPDGLSDPLQYFQRLQKYFILACAKEIDREGSPGCTSGATDRELLERLETTDTPHLYVLGEKILAMDERLNRNWPIDGTTGYRFVNMINGLFIDPAGDRPFTDLYRDLTGARTNFDNIVYDKKKFVMANSMASERTMLTERLVRIAASTRSARDISRRLLDAVIVETIACFSVYRTYITASGFSDEDVSRIDRAIAQAKKRRADIEPMVFEFLRATLLRDDPDCRAFANRFQQLSAPVMAKGVEDTAFYTYDRLVSLNEVGGEPSRFGIGPGTLHEYFGQRQAYWPFAMSTLSTHDTKRSEDVRARLNVLSEIPAQWSPTVRSWMEMNHADRSAGPTANEEYLIYQSMVGIWPLTPVDRLSSDWIDRINAYLVKAMREGKETSRWIRVNEPHETAVAD